MKLYATTTSERASKGQGGNDFLHIHTQDDKLNTILDIDVRNRESEIYVKINIKGCEPQTHIIKKS